MPILSFEDAVEAAKFVPASTPTATKSKIYGLYKCATVGPHPKNARPSAWSIEARMKWDAWVANSNSGKIASEEAKVEYIELIDSLLGKDPSSAHMTEVELPTINTPTTTTTPPSMKESTRKKTSSSSNAAQLGFEQIQQLLKQLETEGKVLRDDMREDIKHALTSMQVKKKKKNTSSLRSALLTPPPTPDRARQCEEDRDRDYRLCSPKNKLCHGPCGI